MYNIIHLVKFLYDYDKKFEKIQKKEDNNIEEETDCLLTHEKTENEVWIISLIQIRWMGNKSRKTMRWVISRTGWVKCIVKYCLWTIGILLGVFLTSHKGATFDKTDTDIMEPHVWIIIIHLILHPRYNTTCRRSAIK